MGILPRIGFVVTSPRLSAAKVVKVYNGRAEMENRIKEGKNTGRGDKTGQTPDQSGGRGFLSRRAVICAYRLGLSPGAPLSGGTGVGCLGRSSIKICLSRGGGMQSLCEKLIDFG